MGTGYFPIVKLPGRVDDPPTIPIFSAEIFKRVELYLYLP
jgi:hypothetical protein